MRRLLRSGSRALSAILAATMILTSLPVSGMSAYADETTAQVQVDAAGTEDVAVTEEAVEIIDDAVGPQMDDSAEVSGTGDNAVGDTTSADDSGSADDVDGVDDNDDVNDTAPAEDADNNIDNGASDGSEDTADDVIPDDTAVTPDIEENVATEEIDDEVSDAEITPQATSEDDFEWDGTTITKYTGTDANVVIPAKATAIGKGAFSNFNLASVELNGNIGEISEMAFSGCANLVSVKPLDGVKRIKDGAFANCRSLSSIDLPDGLTEIGKLAFYDCSSLTKIEIPDTVTDIGQEAFLTAGLTEVHLPDRLKTIEKGIFRGCSNLTTINIPDTVMSIGERAFYYCESLTKVDIPDTVTSIGERAFGSCSSLTEVHLPDQLETIGEYVFFECGSLTTINMPSALKTIGECAFACCYQIAELRFAGNGNVDIDDNAFFAKSDSYTDTLVYCAANSKVYNYFKDKKGYKVITTGSSNTETAYSITYDLNGGTLPAGKANPTSYTASKAVTLVSPTRSGYAFTGWKVNDTDNLITNGKIAAGTYTGDLTLTAQWRAYSYRLTWNANAKDALGTMDPVILTFAENYTIPAENYTRSGYDFTGRNTKANGKGTSYNEGDVISGLATNDGATVTLYAQWRKGIYEINYELNGGTNNKSNPDSYEPGKKVALKNPTRDGYTFAGWYTDEDCTNQIKQITDALGDVTVYAAWTENTYTIAFAANKGTGRMDSVTTGYAQNMTLPESTFTRKGYTFSGWNTNAKGTGTSYAAGEEVSGLVSKNKGKITLYAVWSLNEIPITYELGEGAKNADKNPAYVTILKDVKLSNPTRDGYKFKGWYTDEDLTQALSKNTISKNTTDPVTVYAAWGELAGPLYEIEYENVENWDNSRNPSLYSAAADVRLVSPTREGYTFKGWYAEDPTQNPKAKKVTKISKKETGDRILYGVWSENTYTITYNANKGSLPKGVKMTAQTVNYSNEVTLTANAYVRANYTFLGWNTTAKGTGESYEDGEAVQSLISKNKGKVTLYAQWAADEFTITYVNADETDGVDNSANPETYTVEKDVTLGNPEAYGYTFKGWYGVDPEQNPKAKKVTKISKKTAADVTLYALWSENSYNLRFSTGTSLGSSVKTVMGKLYTDEFTIPATEPTKDGATFQGWALTKNGTVLYHPGDTVTFEQIHEAGAAAKGLVGTKYFTLYAIYE